MSNASGISPFAAAVDNVPWVLWQKQEPVSTLHSEEEKTDSRSVFANSEPDHSYSAAEEMPATTMHIPRPQYHSVLNRMNQASRKTSAFSAWGQ